MSGILGQIGARSGVLGSGTDSTQLVYEEGTWTPIKQANGSGGDEIGEFTVNSCTYTKIGNQVFLSCRITESGGAPSNANAITFKNLPFASTETGWNCVGSASTTEYGNATVLNDNYGDNIIWSHVYINIICIRICELHRLSRSYKCNNKCIFIW